MPFKGITIGIPREIMPGEKRVATTPDSVRLFAGAGAKVLIEAGAGEGSYLSDGQYREAGAEIVSTPEEIYKSANLILKVKEPLFNEQLQIHEAELLSAKTTLVTFLHPANPANHQTVHILARKGVTSFTLDGIPRISRAQQMDCLTSMSTIAGYKAAIYGAFHLPRFIPMMPTAFGVIKPAEFLVIGVGVAGLQAIATAKRLGAKIKALDIRPEANEQAKSLGAEAVPFDVPPELALGKGGYALRLPDEWYVRERAALLPVLKNIDVLILTALIPGEQAPLLVDDQMVAQMKQGSVIVDIAVDQGGNCTLTRPGEEYRHHGVYIIGIKNVPADLAADATWMFAQNIWHFLKYIIKDGKINCDPSDEIIEKTLVTKDGKIVHRGTLQALEQQKS